MRIQVAPEMLAVASTQGSALASTLATLQAALAGLAADAGGAGDPGASAAITACVEDWSATLGALSHSVSAMGTNLAGAAGAYSLTDSSAMGGG